MHDCPAAKDEAERLKSTRPVPIRKVRKGWYLVRIVDSSTPQGTTTAAKRQVAQYASNASIDSMATLTVRQLDEKTKARLRVRAAHHGRSMEEEAREILRAAVNNSSPAEKNLAEAIHRRFAALGVVELELRLRVAMRKAPGFGN